MHLQVSTHMKPEKERKTSVKHSKEHWTEFLHIDLTPQPTTTQYLQNEAYCTHFSVKEEYPITLKDDTDLGVDIKIQH